VYPAPATITAVLAMHAGHMCVSSGGGRVYLISEFRFDRLTTLTLPLAPPPQKN
jgi:hypothetical protein